MPKMVIRGSTSSQELSRVIIEVNSLMRNERGVILIIALLFITISFAIIGGTMKWVNNEAKLTKKRNDSVRAFYLADAGIKRAVWQMDQDTYSINTSSINVNFGEGNYAAVLTRNGNQVTITATGTVNNEIRRLSALVELRSVLADYLVLVDRSGGTWTSGSGAQYGQPDPGHPEYPEGVSMDQDDRMKMYIMGDYVAQSNVDIYGDLFIEGDCSLAGDAQIHGDAYIGGDLPSQGDIDDGYGLADGDGATDTHTLSSEQTIEYPTINTSYYSANNDLSLGGTQYLSFVDAGDHTIVERYTDSSYTSFIESHSLPSSAVIYVDGDANVRGTVSGNLTVVASDDLGFRGDIDYANGTHYADTNNSAAFLAYDDLRFYPANLEVSGIFFTEVGNFDGSVGGSKSYLRIYGNRIMASQSSMSAYPNRAYLYDANLKANPPPNLPVNPIMTTWDDLGR